MVTAHQGGRGRGGKRRNAKASKVSDSTTVGGPSASPPPAEPSSPGRRIYAISASGAQPSHHSVEPLTLKRKAMLPLAQDKQGARITKPRPVVRWQGSQHGSWRTTSVGSTGASSLKLITTNSSPALWVMSITSCQESEDLSDSTGSAARTTRR